MSRGIKRFLVETVAYIFTDILFLESHSPYFFKKWLKLLKDKAVEIIPKNGRTEKKVGLGSGKNNNIWNSSINTYFIFQNVVCSVIRNGFNSIFFWGEMYLSSSCLLASLLLCKTPWISNISYFFCLDELWKQYHYVSQEMMETVKLQEIPIKVAMRNILLHRNLLSRLWRKSKFSYNYLAMVEGLKQSQEVFCKKGDLKNFANFAGTTTVLVFPFSKVADLRPATLLKRDCFWRGCLVYYFSVRMV